MSQIGEVNKDIVTFFHKAQRSNEAIIHKGQRSNEGHGQKLTCQHEDLVPIVNMCEYEPNW